MLHILSKKRTGPIGLDIGTRSVKLVQLSEDRDRLVDASRWDFPVRPDGSSEPMYSPSLVDTIQQAREGRTFRGREAVICLTNQQVFLQNLRLPKSGSQPLDRQIETELATRLPFPIEESEVRHIEADDVRQGDQVLREVLVLAAQRSAIHHVLESVEAAGLRPLAMDVEPAALARSYACQFRREEDQERRSLLVHIGYARTIVVIAENDHMIFVKYLEIGGRDFDQAVARHLGLSPDDATALRRQSEDRRSDQKDPDLVRTISEAMRSPMKALLNELAMCARYYSVSFRGCPLSRVLVSGGEATAQIASELEQRMGITATISDPMRAFPTDVDLGRRGQWDVALGLALREVA